MHFQYACLRFEWNMVSLDQISVISFKNGKRQQPSFLPLNASPSSSPA